MQKHYNAHWGTLLIVLSTLLTVLLVWLAIAEFKQGTTSANWVGLYLLALVVGCALFTIRGYTITPDAILVHRLFWATRLPRAGLQSAQFEPFRLRGNIRIGNGGFFSFSGSELEAGSGPLPRLHHQPPSRGAAALPQSPRRHLPRRPRGIRPRPRHHEPRGVMRSLSRRTGVPPV